MKAINYFYLLLLDRSLRQHLISPYKISPFFKPASSIIAGSVLCLAFYIQDIYAQPLPIPPSPAQLELDQMEKERLQENINRQLNKNRQDSVIQLAPTPTEADHEPAQENGPKFLINKITIDVGEHAAIAVNVSDILKNYENQELGNHELFALIRDITNRYAERGFSTTTISLVPKNMKEGSIELKVNWGYVEGWLVNGQKPEGAYKNLVTAFAMPGLVGKPLNIHEVDQMVENLNNAAKTAQIDIQPSPRVGYSYLNLVTQEKPLSLNVRADNSGPGSPSDGRYRFSASTSLSDLLLGNDTLGLNLSSRRYQVSHANSEYNAGVSYSVPFGFSQIELRFNHSQYEKTLTGGKYGEYSTTGDSQTYSAGLRHVLMREKTKKLTVLTELQHKKNFNYLEGSLIKTNSNPYTSVAVGLEHLTQFIGGSLYSDIKFNQGISTWESTQAAYKKNKQSTQMQKVEFHTAWSRAFNWLEKDFNFSSKVGGQYSKNNLTTAEQLGIGDEFTVRGFRGPALWGDQGVYISNSVSLPIQALGGTITPLIGIDSGYVRNVAYPQNNGGITGLALGASGNWQYGGASITLGLPLTMDEAIRKNTDASVLYISTYLSF